LKALKRESYGGKPIADKVKRKSAGPQNIAESGGEMAKGPIGEGMFSQKKALREKKKPQAAESADEGPYTVNRA